MINPIKSARLAAGFTLGEAAKELHIPVGYLSQIENGQRQVDPVRAEKIAHLYKVARDKIFLASRYAVREVSGE
ncbi:helix-turn-helix transcriptional regulator [Paenibacillus sp. VCA1]|uniref:helix-turn-helix domain-containing protein n=1 Tax=Paenibacillus sp. VCA1 TaxID=3039148 RepID=UPI00287121FA|nr:helix-turn-helix transcriptional regulator [Paenibacillus sp. VCA1]MDR9857838.1 helix-turn-helix transcriptional regulator [Paenibacillus sp. VCA1]